MILNVVLLNDWELYEWYLRKIEEYNPNNELKILIICDGKISDMFSN